MVSPLFGAWSDRIWAGWLGRRRPFILVGGLLSALILAFTPAITRWAGSLLPASLPAETALILPAIVAVFLFTLTFNTMDDVHGALMADLTEGAERNRLSALKVLVGMLGQVGILVVGFFLWRDGIPDSAFLVTGAIIACGVLVTVLGVGAPAPAIWAPEQGRERWPRLLLAGLVGAVPGGLLLLRGHLRLLVQGQHHAARLLHLLAGHPGGQRRRGPAAAFPAPPQHHRDGPPHRLAGDALRQAP